MNTFSINPRPFLTRSLVEAGAFKSDPLVVIDLGARGGINPEWQVFGDQIRLLCFEPDEQECLRLAQEAPPNITYIPWAIGKSAGQATLYETKLAASTGLYRTNMGYFERFLNRDNGQTVAEHQVDVHTLDEALAAHGHPTVDFVKIDVEGAELDVFEGGATCLNAVLGLVSEIRFHPEINGSPPFAALDANLMGRGFRIYDLQFYHQSREVLPYPGICDYRLPNGERFFAYTTHGQIQDGDALYFRDLLLTVNRDCAQAMSPTRLLKLCALLEVYSLNDCAAELIVAFESIVGRDFDCSRLLELLASGVYGRKISYDQYRHHYFADRPPQRDNPATRFVWRALAWGLRRALAAANRRLGGR